MCRACNASSIPTYDLVGVLDQDEVFHLVPCVEVELLKDRPDFGILCDQQGFVVTAHERNVNIKTIGFLHNQGRYERPICVKCLDVAFVRAVLAIDDLRVEDLVGGSNEG